MSSAELEALALEIQDGRRGNADRPIELREWGLLHDTGKLPDRGLFVRNVDGGIWYCPGRFEGVKAASAAAARHRINPERRFLVGKIDRSSGVLEVQARNLRREEAESILGASRRSLPCEPGSYPFAYEILEADLTGRFIRIPGTTRWWRHPDELPGAEPS